MLTRGEIMARILVVDDAKFAQFKLKKTLNSDGHEVETADDGLLGLEKIATTEIPYDLIVSDLLMPNMSGEEFVAALKEKGIVTPIIVHSANIQETVRENCLILGVDGFINKATKPAELLALVTEVLSKTASH
jgi:CheY-like chemotaxis protein